MAERYNRARVNNAVPAKASTQEYVITDPNHRADLNGEFAGAKVQMRGSQQIVRLSQAGAQFYVDQGVLKLLNAEKK